MATHKFTIGQAVRYAPAVDEPAAERGSYTVTRLLPRDDEGFQYHVKHVVTGELRRVRETQLS